MPSINQAPPSFGIEGLFALLGLKPSPAVHRALASLNLVFPAISFRSKAFIRDNGANHPLQAALFEMGGAC